MRQRVRLGELLVQEAIISPEQLQEALEHHRTSGLRLGEYLYKNRICQEEDIVRAVAKQLGIARYTSDVFDFAPEVREFLPQDVAQRTGAIPLRRQGSVITVAMQDPLNIDALDAIEFATNCEVEPVICTEDEFNRLFSSVYGQFTSLDGIIGTISETVVAGVQDTRAGSGADINIADSGSDEAPAIRLINSILANAVREGASDVHLGPEKDHVQVRFRIDGKLRESSPAPKVLGGAMVSRIKILGNMDIAVTRVPQDGRFTMRLDSREINVRVSCLPTIYGENVVMRLLDMTGKDYTLDQLGMQADDHEKINQCVKKPYGMILSTGPTGSGKSTSLYSILKVLNQPDVNLITLEDPVEYRLKGVRQAQLNAKAGMSFAEGLRSILRQDPDVVMIGEIRDGETASIAMQAALTGHLVLSTLHTNDAAGAATRLIDMGIEPFLVSSALLVVFAQRLVRRVCSHCSEPYEPPLAALQAFGIASLEGHTFRRGGGCHQCSQSGYRGRCGIFEILTISPHIQELIIKQCPSSVIADAAVEAGIMRTLQQDAAMKICAGITTVEEAARVVLT